MTGRALDPSPRVYARVAGIGYLVIFVTGIFAEFFVRSSLIQPGDPAATAAAIAESASLVRGAVASEFLMLTADLVLAGAFYVIFAGVSRSLALLAAFFRIAHAAVVGVNILNTYVPLLALSGTLDAFTTAQRGALAQLFLEAQAFGYTIGLVFFGVHLLILGYLAFRSGFVPRVLGVLLLIAAAGYLVDSFAQTLLANYADFEPVFAIVVFVPAFVGELSFALWLLVRGGRVPDGTDPLPAAARS